MPQVIGLRCPHCAAALPAEAGATSVKCAYCGTTSILQRNGTVAPTAPPPSSGRGMFIGLAVLGLVLGVGLLFAAGRTTSSSMRPIPPSVAVAQPRPTVPPIAAPLPIPEVPRRVLESIETDRRPMLADVDHDGTTDIVALAHFREGDRRWAAYAAFTGATDEPLWTLSVADDELRNTHAAVAHGRLLVLGGTGQVRGHDLETGAVQWSTALGDRGAQFCGSPVADTVDIPTVDDRRLRLDVKTGKQSPVAVANTCAALPTDQDPNDDDPASRVDTRAPAGTVAIRCGHISTYTSAGFSKLPDPCRTRTKIDVDNLPGLVAHALWQTDRGWLVLGVRQPGTGVPTIALLDNKTKKLTWKADVPEGNPLLADVGGPDPAILLGDRVVVGYTVRDQPPHLASFNLADGARQWTVDVPGGKRVQRTTTANGHLHLYADGSIYVLNPTDGKLLRTLGKASPR